MSIQRNCLILLSVFAFLLNPPYAQSPAKKRIAVVPFGFNTAMPEYLQDKEDLAAGLTDKLNAAITELGRFEVVERVKLNEILYEQALGQSGVLDESSVAKVGSVAGVELVVTGAINQYSNAYESSEGKVSVYRSRISISVRFVDAQTGVVKQAAQIETDATGSSASVARFQAVSDAVGKIVDQIKQLYPLSSQIVKKEGTVIYLSMGSDLGVKNGMQFKTIDASRQITDASGKILGTEKIETGIIKVIYVDKGFSKAKIIKDKGGIDVGDEVQELAVNPKIGISIGFSLFQVNAGAVNAQPDTIIYYTDYWAMTTDTAVPDFSGNKPPSMMLGGLVCLEVPEIANSPVGTQFIFNYVLSNGDLRSFLFDWTWSYSFPLIADRFWIPVGAGFSIGRMRYDYPYARQYASQELLQTYGLTDAVDEVSQLTWGFVGFTGVRVRLAEHVDILGQVGYRWHPALSKWEIEYKTGEKDNNGNDKTEKLTVDNGYLPFEKVSIMGFDVRAGVSFVF